jgi:hypothetical protein
MTVRSATLWSLLVVLGGTMPARAQVGPAGVSEQWAEVVSVAPPRWIVLQNARGQQFPVAIDAVGMFLTRWPTTLDRVTPNALVEANGVDAESNRVITDQLDVYEGGAQGLVTPALQFVSGSGRVSRPIDFTFNADVYGELIPGLAPPIHGGVAMGPSRLHVVGPLINRVPPIILTEGNNRITVLPPPAGLRLTQITIGTISDVRPGDLVFFVAQSARPKSLILEQMIVYKRMPIDQFAR